MRSIRKYLLLLLAVPKSLIFNFRYFRLPVAIKLPVLVSHRVWLMSLGGNVILTTDHIKPGLIQIGFGEVGIFDQHRSRSVWQVGGRVNFCGSARIGHGSKIIVGDNATLVLGDRFAITAESAIVAMDRIEIGHEVLISWDTLIMDTDFHSIYDEHGLRLNPNAPVVIGSRVWIGCRCLVLKGSAIPDGAVIAAASTVLGRDYSPRSIIGGNPARVLKMNVRWKV